jgi:hypothetical protein
LVVSSVERTQFEADRRGDLGDLVGGGLEVAERRGGDAHDPGVEELAVPGDEFFFSLLDGSGGAAVVGPDAEALLGSLLGV